jgi:hypothetical protein
MQTYLILGAAAFVAASPAPAPQAFEINKVAAIPVTITRGAPVGVGPAEVTGIYNQDAALATATAAASGATTAAVEKRNVKPGTTTAPATSVSTYAVPSTCTPPETWVNTNAFTTDPACSTPYEVGTYCGFINPEDPCAPQPYGYGPSTTPDTVDAFKANPVYHAFAKSAKTPSGYTNTFTDLNASVNANSYMGYKQMTSYDVASCASYCESTNLCTGFNMYIERDPEWNPDQCSCKNPTSMANFKCSIWGSGVQKEAAVNYGETRDDFKVIIVASNGYEKKTTPANPPGYKNPQDCGKKLHDKPKNCLGQQSFPGPFDVGLCAAYATQQNAVNQKAGLWNYFLSMFGLSPGKCVQFQAAELDKDGAAWGTHCRLFTKKFEAKQAVYDLGGEGSAFSCGKSFTWDLA